MRTVYLKTTLANPNAANLTLSDPGAIGPQDDGDVIRYLVTDVPESVTDLQVLYAFRETATVRGVGREPDDPAAWTYRYDELGPGRIVR